MVEHYNKLVKLVARAFYEDLTSKGDNQPKSGRSDNRGIAVVILDALTRRQWVREEDLAKDLKLHTKQLRRTLRFFEEEKIITRFHRKETAKGAKIFSAAVAATVDAQHPTKEGEEKVKLHTHSYCCLDYAQIYDVVRYRLHRMKHKLKDELDNKNTVQEYICTTCGKRYNALDALRLISFEDDDFHCESCNGKLEIESDKIAAQDGGDVDENARRRRREKLKDMLQKLESELKPLTDQLNRVKDLPVPDFGNLQAWEARAAAAGRAAGGDGSDKSQLGPIPYSGDTKVVVDFNGSELKGAVKSETESNSLKVLPPWMIRQGMVLTREQRGEVKQETKMDGTSTSTATQYSDDKKSSILQEDNKNIQARRIILYDEYIKAYYAALLKQQEEWQDASKNQEPNAPAAEDPSSSTSNRQVGVKSKREEDEEDDGTEWEDAPFGGIGNGYKVNDLNVKSDKDQPQPQADASDDDDDVDWEEG
ncbi:uncharacterized protein LOC130950842 isoform X1 [Arachis stenosperma]|uniref:uncharacterized protein LOC130950842 isoform X1 n=1 Tax=Arachis stenosperma TaxID=217475 RepID=UPI0025AB8B73|nr:uncharacterized protein LOC130950842 isoform X1 [Arachis stenosperma]